MLSVCKCHNSHTTCPTSWWFLCWCWICWMLSLIAVQWAPTDCCGGVQISLAYRTDPSCFLPSLLTFHYALTILSVYQVWDRDQDARLIYPLPKAIRASTYKHTFVLALLYITLPTRGCYAAQYCGKSTISFYFSWPGGVSTNEKLVLILVPALF